MFAFSSSNFRCFRFISRFSLYISCATFWLVWFLMVFAKQWNKSDTVISKELERILSDLRLYTVSEIKHAWLHVMTERDSPSWQLLMEGIISSLFNVTWLCPRDLTWVLEKSRHPFIGKLPLFCDLYHFDNHLMNKLTWYAFKWITVIQLGWHKFIKFERRDWMSILYEENAWKMPEIHSDSQ